MRAVFRADASPGIGGGHVARCMTLADALAERGWGCSFACSPATPETVPALASSGHELAISQDWTPAALNRRWPEGCALLVVDHYALDATFETACRPWADRILVIDDLADRPHDADLLLDQTFGRDAADYRRLLPARARILTGCGYALLRPDFAALRNVALRRRDERPDVRRILVSLGMGDPDNVTGLALRGIEQAGLDVSVDVVLGSQAPHLAEVRRLAQAMTQPVDVSCDVRDMPARIAAADLAIGAGGTTSWERCCLGLPTLAIVIAENQVKIARELHGTGALWMLGWRDGVSPSDVVRAIQTLTGDPERRAAMGRTAASLCDGFGTARVVREIFHDASCLVEEAASSPDCRRQSELDTALRPIPGRMGGGER